MGLTDKLNERVLSAEASILEALKQMDVIDGKLLLVFREERFMNILSIGDIQRAILGGVGLESPVANILREHTRVAKDTDPFSEVKKQMESFRMEMMPVIDASGKLVDVHFWNEVFGPEERVQKKDLEIPVVIMAGGLGTRMRPLTNIIPKPLLPFGDRSMAEEIIHRFLCVGCTEFHMSVNYKAEMIDFYFEQLERKPYRLNLFKEEKPLGTAGSLHLLNGKVDTTFFVSNCDILIDDDYHEIYDYHVKNGNELTIVSALKNYPIPYGTLETGENGQLMGVSEKPNLNFQINTGFYVVEPHLLNEIPTNEFFHITHLMDKILERKGKVGVFPVSEGSWRDVGNWEEYQKTFG